MDPFKLEDDVYRRGRNLSAERPGEGQVQPQGTESDGWESLQRAQCLSEFWKETEGLIHCDD